MHRRFWIVAGLLVIINVAGLLWIRHELIDTTDPSDRPLRVIAKLPQNNIDTTERISIVFDQAVVAESELDVPLEAPPFIIDPALPGYWKWAEPRRLEFILDEPLPPGRKFTVKPTANLELQANRVVQVDAELDFQTQPLKLIEHRVQSSDRYHVYVELKFNQEV